MTLKLSEELKPGDIIKIWYSKYSMITQIRPYCGPLKDLGCFAIAETKPGPGISLFKGDYFEVADAETKF